MDIIRELRVNCGLTQKEFSDILGFSQQAVSKWENNTAEPDIPTLIKIAQYFEVSVDELLGLDPPDQKRKSTPQEDDSVRKGDDFSNILKALRKEKHLTQKQLAAETGLSLSSIISYENGLREPNLKAMVTLEKFFGVSGEYLSRELSDEENAYQMSSMDLDEAIEHCREKENCTLCGQEHKQLREWLSDYKRISVLKSLLFEETVYQRDEAARLRKPLDEFDPFSNIIRVSPLEYTVRAKFMCCFDLIVRSGLEDEYYEWQKTRKEEQNE